MTLDQMARRLRVAALQLLVPDEIAEAIADDCMFDWEQADWDVDDTDGELLTDD